MNTHSSPTSSGPRQVLAALIAFSGVDRDFAHFVVDVIYRLAGTIILVIGVPMSIHREFNVFSGGKWWVPVAIGATAVLFINHRIVPATLRAPLLISASTLASVFMVLRNESLTIGGFPLLLALSALFFHQGTRATLALLIAYTVIVLALLAQSPEFDPYTSLLGYGANISCGIILLGAIFSIHIEITREREAAEGQRRRLRLVRDDHFREVSLLTKELRGPATAIFTLTQLPKIPERSKADIGRCLEQLGSITRQLVSGMQTDLPTIINTTNLSYLIFNVSQQIQPLLLGRDVKFSLDAAPELNREYLVDSLRVQGALTNLCRAGLFVDGVTDVRCKAFLIGGADGGGQLSFVMTVTASAKSCARLQSLYADRNTSTHINDLCWRELVQCAHWVTQLNGEFGLDRIAKDRVELFFRLKLEGSPTAISNRVVITPALRGKKVLVVDDDSLTRTTTKTLLERHFGSTVSCANDPAEAIGLMGDEIAFDLILSDFMMPGATGVELIKWVRERNHDVGIIVATATAKDTDIRELLDQGANLVLPKPLTSDALNAALISLNRGPGHGDQ